MSSITNNNTVHPVKKAAQNTTKIGAHIVSTSEGLEKAAKIAIPVFKGVSLVHSCEAVSNLCSNFSNVKDLFEGLQVISRLNDWVNNRDGQLKGKTWQKITSSGFLAVLGVLNGVKFLNKVKVLPLGVLSNTVGNIPIIGHISSSVALGFLIFSSWDNGIQIHRGAKDLKTAKSKLSKWSQFNQDLADISKRKTFKKHYAQKLENYSKYKLGSDDLNEYIKNIETKIEKINGRILTLDEKGDSLDKYKTLCSTKIFKHLEKAQPDKKEKWETRRDFLESKDGKKIKELTTHYQEKLNGLRKDQFKVNKYVAYCNDLDKTDKDEMKVLSKRLEHKDNQYKTLRSRVKIKLTKSILGIVESIGKIALIIIAVVGAALALTNIFAFAITMTAFSLVLASIGMSKFIFGFFNKEQAIPEKPNYLEQAIA